MSGKAHGISLINIITEAGIKVRTQGTRGYCKCPFHDEKNGSMVIYDDDNFYCFGCGASGDQIEFVMRFYSIGFKDTLSFLGIEAEKPWQPSPPSTPKVPTMADALEFFEDWQVARCQELLGFLRYFRRIHPDQKNKEKIINRMTGWEYELSVYQDEWAPFSAKFALFERWRKNYLKSKKETK